MNLGVVVTVAALPTYWIAPFAATLNSGGDGDGATTVRVGTKGAKLYCDSNAVIMTSRLFAL